MNFNAEGSFLALLPFRLFWMAWVQSPVTSPDLPHLPDSSHFFPFLISPSQFMPPPFVEIGVSHNCQLHEIPLPSRKKKNSSYSKIDPSSFNFLLQVHQVCWFTYYSPPTLLSGWFSLELSISFPWTALTLPFYCVQEDFWSLLGLRLREGDRFSIRDPLRHLTKGGLTLVTIFW